jgi:nucleoside-diphosphate-sugar epimerase
MRVLVTGADGYIGIILAPVLIERGHDVVALDTGYYRDGWLFHNPSRQPAMITRDIRSLSVDDLTGYDAVVHLAELSNDPLGQLNPEVTFEINHRGSVALARACKQAGVQRFVYASSCSVYGIGANDVKTETSEVNPQTAYAHCKVLVERDVAALADDIFSPTFLRNATAFGPSPRQRFDLVLNNLSALAWTTGRIAMTSDGTPWRPLAHIRDISEAVACVLAAERELVHNEIFNVGDSQANYQIRDVAQIIADVFPNCELTFGTNDSDNRSYRVSFDKIHARLPEFHCRFDAVAGAQQFRALFEHIGLSRDTFEARSYTRLKQLTHLIQTKQVDQHLFWAY